MVDEWEGGILDWQVVDAVGSVGLNSINTPGNTVTLECVRPLVGDAHWVCSDPGSLVFDNGQPWTAPFSGIAQSN